MNNAFETIATKIAAAIESGNVGSYQMPWHNVRGGIVFPVNAVSKKFYRGVNTLNLWCAQMDKGYASAKWATYKQWTELGAQVRKGEKATECVLWKPMVGTPKSKQASTEQGDSKHKWLMARLYFVFNADQVDGYVDTDAALPVEDGHERIEAAERFFANLKADVQHGGNRACYIPSLDRIQMPPLNQFVAPEGYYSTLGHEHTHWTAAPVRLDRNLTGAFGDPEYAMEELIAELAAAFLMAELGLANEPRVDHAQYVASWLRALDNDPKAIFSAASKAQAAVDYMKSLQKETAEQREEEVEA